MASKLRAIGRASERHTQTCGGKNDTAGTPRPRSHRASSTLKTSLPMSTATSGLCSAIRLWMARNVATTDGSVRNVSVMPTTPMWLVSR